MVPKTIIIIYYIVIRQFDIFRQYRYDAYYKRPTGLVKTLYVRIRLSKSHLVARGAMQYNIYIKTI